MIRRDRGALPNPPARVDRSPILTSFRGGLSRISSMSRRASLLAAGGGLLILVGLSARTLLSADTVHAADPPAPVPHPQTPNEAARPPDPTPARPATLVALVALAVSLEEFRGDAANPCAACGLPDTVNAESPPWKDWVSLGGTRLDASSSAASVPIYAARTQYGLAAMVANHGESKADFTLTIKLGRGVYTAERWVFDPQAPDVAPRIDRLESLVLGKTSSVEKPGWLPAGQAAIYKFTNRCIDVQASFDSVRQAVRSMQAQSPSGCRTVMVPLRECEAHLASLSKGIRPEKRYDSLRYIHRALLTVNHAQALAENLREQGRLPREGADRLEGALDHLQTALTDLSAGCLNLLPSLTIAPPDETKPGVRSVTVQLANAGQQPVSLVRLGADAARGATVVPAERAIFDVLRPGETARATFTVRLPEDSSANDLSAEIAWFAARTPAHLRLKGSF